MESILQIVAESSWTEAKNARRFALVDVGASRIKRLSVTPAEQLLTPGGSYALQVEAEFVDGSKEDVTKLSGYKSLDERTASVDRQGLVQAIGVGDVAIAVRFRDEPVMVMALVASAALSEQKPAGPNDAARSPENFIDTHILAKLRRLNLPPAELADDATFLRRARLDVTGLLPMPDEVRDFLADTRPDKRQIKIDELLEGTGYLTCGRSSSATSSRRVTTAYMPTAWESSMKPRGSRPGSRPVCGRTRPMTSLRPAFCWPPVAMAGR